MITEDEVVDALSAVLDALIAHERQATEAGPSKIEAVSIQEIQESLPTLGRYNRDPIGAALRAGVSEIGQEAAPFFSFKQMQSMAEEAADRNDDYQVRISVISHRWDGLKCLDGSVWLA